MWHTETVPVFPSQSRRPHLGRLAEHLVQADELKAGQHLDELAEGLQLDGVAAHQRQVHQPAPARVIWGRYMVMVIYPKPVTVD